MVLTFYVNTASKETLDKTEYLTQVGSSRTFNEFLEVDIDKPTFCAAYDGNAQILTSNYLHIGAPFNKYYYITSLSLDTARRLNLELEVDALMSNKDEILNLDVIVRRNEFTEPNYMFDDEFPINSDRKDISKISFPLLEIPTVHYSEYILVTM